MASCARHNPGRRPGFFDARSKARGRAPNEHRANQPRADSVLRDIKGEPLAGWCRMRPPDNDIRFRNQRAARCCSPE